MDDPIITVITPTLNQAQYIRMTIESVLAQDYPAMEYFVVDGGSTDGSLEILHTYRDRLSWISEPDEGQSQAINKGWQRTRGEIITWLNSDDIYFPGALQKVGDFFKKHPEAEFIYGDCQYIDQDGIGINLYPVEPFDYTKLVVDTHNYIPQPSTFLRRRTWEAIGGLDERLHYVMDFEYWLRAGLRYNFMYAPVLLSGLRIHDSAKSIASLDKMALELVAIYQRFFLSSNLPLHLRAIESEAMSMIYYRAADCFFWAGKPDDARSYAWKSWLIKPNKLRRLWPYLLLGQAGWKIAKKRMSNPYLVRG